MSNSVFAEGPEHLEKVRTSSTSSLFWISFAQVPFPKALTSEIGEMSSLAPLAEQGQTCGGGRFAGLEVTVEWTLQQWGHCHRGGGKNLVVNLGGLISALPLTGFPLTGTQFPCLQIGRLNRHPGR